MSPDRDAPTLRLRKARDLAWVGPREFERRVRACLRNEEGAAILEFAIVLPLLIALVFGCYELGRAALIQQVMVTAVRGGARYLARVPDPGCDPICARGAASAIEMTVAEIAANTGLARTAIRVEPMRDPAFGSVGLTATVEFAFDVAVISKRATSWTLTAAHWEPRIAD